MATSRNYFHFITRPDAVQIAQGGGKVNLPATALVVRSKLRAASLPANADVPFDSAAGKVYTQQVSENGAGTIFTVQVAGYYNIGVSVPDAPDLLLGLRKINRLGVSSVIGTNALATEFLHTIEYFDVGEGFAVFQSGPTTVAVSGANRAWLEVTYASKNTV